MDRYNLGMIYLVIATGLTTGLMWHRFTTSGRHHRRYPSWILGMWFIVCCIYFVFGINMVGA